jgi:hypothetical protein
MGILEFVFEIILEAIVWTVFRHIGACIKWPFLCSRYSYKQILETQGNGLLGVFFFIILTILFLLL